MGRRTEHKPGTFSWVELATADPDGAATFYEAVFGWVRSDSSTDDAESYKWLKLDGEIVAGFYRLEDDQQVGAVPAHWRSYVTVEAADDAAARAGDLGGTVLKEPAVVDGSRRMTLIQDPIGAVVGLWEPRGHIGVTRVNDPGCLCWNDLVTADPAAATRFYGGLFGWDVQELEGAGGYRVIQNAGASNGGMMPSEMAGGAPPHWLAYFNAGELERALATVEEAGGRVVAPPRQVPAGRFAFAQDPHDAVFGLFEGDVDD
jgi:predicted enzyme related to lactoylglutathione lyase